MEKLSTLVTLLVIIGSAVTHTINSPLTRQELGYNEEEDKLERTLRNNERSPYRLPTSTLPLHYQITLTPYFSPEFNYDGTVEIHLVPNEADVQTITIHSSDDIEISSLVLTLNNVEIPLVTGNQYTYNSEYEFLMINTQSALTYPLADGVYYVLTIQYTAPLRNDMYGFYRSWFTNDNETKWMASTQFQPTSARKAFPCYDEPSFQATFVVILRRLPEYTTWSNMRLQSTSAQQTDGRVIDTFYSTPLMSTYLLAFIVAEYSSLPVYNITSGLLTYEVIARPNAIQDGQGDYALTVGQQLLSWMDNYTEINFADMDANIKMTQAAIPDFSAGAMENWGLLTYREAYLLYHNEHTNNYYKQIIAYILSHEIAHMWFGNLVTCEWWDYLWLNEGFARFFQYFLTHGVETDMGLEERFITEQIHTAMSSDSISSAHALTSSVSSPAEVSGHFSTLTYNKGAAVIRITEHMMGAEVFREGLHNYLVNRSYSTALPEHLFAALDEVSVQYNVLDEYYDGFTIDEYFRTWTEQAGVPLININVDYTSGDMTITQARYDRDSGYSDIISNWLIPVNWASKSNPDFTNTKATNILNGTVNYINKGSTDFEWIVFNKQVTGYYRINYDEPTWNLLTVALRGEDRTLIHKYNRAQIVDDVFAFTRSGLMTFTRAFNILSFLEFETDYAPLEAARTWINWLRGRLASQPTQLAKFHTLVQTWTSTAISQVGYIPVDGEEFMTSYLRWRLANLLCNIGVQECRISAVAQFAQLRDNDVEVAPDNRDWVYCNALREGTAADFTFLWNRFVNHNVYTEKILLASALGCTTDATSLTTLLNYITEDNYYIRPQDYTNTFYSAVYSNPSNADVAFTWAQNNLDKLENAFGSLNLPLSYIISAFSTEEQLTAVETWATTNAQSLGTYSSLALAYAASVRSIITWTAERVDDIEEYLDNGYQEVDVTPPNTGDTGGNESPSTEDSASLPAVSFITIALVYMCNHLFDRLF